jgi:hypothetical protein
MLTVCMDSIEYHPLSRYNHEDPGRTKEQVEGYLVI